MELTPDNVRTIARLANLDIEDSRIEDIRQDLSHIMEWINSLNELDVENVEPMLSVFLDEMPRRDDKVTDGNKSAEILANAPGGAQFDMFSVPKVVE